MNESAETNESAFRPSRKTLSHRPPPSVSQYAANAPHFITVCVNRDKYAIAPGLVGKAGPLTGAVADGILATLSHYRAVGKFHPLRAVVMPDHLHLIAQFPEDMSKCMFDFKRYIARVHGIEWQKDYFDHRLRGQAEYEEKSDYLARNPERKGLCASFEDWPYYKVW